MRADTTTITLDDIDPVLAHRVRERVASAPDGVAPDVRAILDQRASAESAMGLLLLILAAVLWAASVMLLVRSGRVWVSEEGRILAAIFGPGLLYVLLAAAGTSALTRLLRARCERRLLRETGLLSDVARTRAEKAYAGFLQSLANAPAPGHGATTPRELVNHANLLLESAHELQRALADTHDALAGETRFSLEAEHRKLLRRAEEAMDPEARDALLRSAELCASRAETARRFDALRERLEAQQEVICQTLASLHTSAAHARLAPGLAAAAGTGGLPQAEAEEAVAEIQRQTRAVEQAVAEVAALRAGGG